MIYTGGYYLYYGDYNSQQIPFYIHAQDFIKNEGLGWDWGTDLGSNFLGSYSFYLLGSPFFWLTVPLPNNLVVFAMPVLLAVKHGVATLTAYAFIRRFVRNKKDVYKRQELNAAIIELNNDYQESQDYIDRQQAEIASRQADIDQYEADNNAMDAEIAEINEIARQQAEAAAAAAAKMCIRDRSCSYRTGSGCK